jgi:hypothetical protein
LLPHRPSTRAYVRSIVRKPSTATGLVVDDQAAAASAASKSAAAASSNAPLSAHPETAAGKGVLLEATARVRTGLAWFRPTHVQLLAAPAALDSMPDAPAWSALVLGGVAVPYEEVAGVRMDESALEFIVEHKPRSTTAQDDPPRQHLRMHTRPEFNLWREALGPIIIAPLSPTSEASKKPTAVHAAQKWLAHAEVGAASCS